MSESCAKPAWRDRARPGSQTTVTGSQRRQASISCRPVEYPRLDSVVIWWRPDYQPLPADSLETRRPLMLLAPIQRIRSVRPGFSLIARLTATATFAYLLALAIPGGTSRPVLAP